MPNHSVEANRRQPAPLQAGSQFGSPFCARPAVPAAVAHLGRSTTESGQVNARRRSQRPCSTRTDDARACQRPPGDPTSASVPSLRWRHGVPHRRGGEIAERPGPSTARLGRLRAGGLWALDWPERCAQRGRKSDKPRSNHSVEANRRRAAPFEAGSQFGSPFSAPPYSPAAVAHLGRYAA
jgi:hypothetical protein